MVYPHQSSTEKKKLLSAENRSNQLSVISDQRDLKYSFLSLHNNVSLGYGIEY